MTTWLEAIAEQRDLIVGSWQRRDHEDEVADSLLSDPDFVTGLDEYGDAIPDFALDDESWRDEPETEW